MIIVLDTSVLYSDPRARKGSMSALVDGARKGDFELRIPEVVVQELTKHFRKQLEELSRDLRQVAASHRELGIDPPAGTIDDTAALGAAYESDLRDRFDGVGTAVTPAPIDLSPLVVWSVGRRKPFKESGVGVPDAIIWLTVLELAPTTDQVILVTANEKDFGDGQVPPDVHADLAADLDQLGVPVDRVRIVTSLKALIDEVVAPLSAPDARATRLLADKSLRAKLVDAIVGALTFADIPQDSLDLGVTIDSDPQATDVSIGRLEVVSAREMADGRLLLELSVEGDLTLDLFVFKGDIAEIDDNPRITVTDSDWNRHVVLAETQAAVEMTVNVTTDLNAEKVDVELVDVATM